jgi:acetylornithine deacetylase/succinyl-diaminopimelate desuccinylase-like protein
VELKKQLLALCALSLSVPGAAAERNSPEGREALEIYREIVEIPTVKGRGEVPRMARLLAARFKKAGFSARDVEIVTIGETAGLIVTYRGTGKARPLLFLAHMDVVEAKAAEWQRDPFKLLEEEGYFYGRGTGDNKAGVAQLTAAFLQLKRQGFRPSRDLIIAFTGDEETDMVTSQALARKLAAVRPEFALNSDSGGGRMDAQGKGVEFAVQVAEKTFATFEVTIRNPGGHSARPRADNAIFELAELLRNLRGHSFPIMGNEFTRATLTAAAEKPNTSPELKAAIQAFLANPGDAEGRALLARAPGLSLTLRTTCVPTQLIGGHAENALPQSATVTINCRIFPGVPVASVQQQLAAVAANPAAEWKLVGNPTQSEPSPVNEALFAALSAAVADRFPALPVFPYMTPGATDGKHFRGVGIPTYGVSGGFSRPGDNSNIHGLNERHPVGEFFASLDFWPKLMKLLGS